MSLIKKGLRICIYIFIVLIQFSGSSSLSLFVAYALILIPIVNIIYQIFNKSKEYNKIRVNIKSIESNLLIIYFVYILISIIYSYDVNSSKNYIIQFFCILLFVIFANYKVEFWEKFKKIIFIMSVIVAVSIFITIINKNFFVEYLPFLLPKYDASLLMYYSELKQDIYSGIMFERAYAAFVLNLGIAVFMSKYFSNEKINKSYYIGLIMIIIALFCTGKRTLFLIPIINFLLLSVINNRNRKFLITIIKSIPIIIILSILVFKFVPSATKVFERFNTETNTNDTMATRFDDFWKYTIEMFNSKPITGYGVKTFKSYIANMRSYHVYEAHNIYLQTLAETGIIGFILLMLLFIFNYKNTLSLLKNEKSKEKLSILNFSIIIQTTFLIYGLTGNTMYYVSQLFIYMITIALSCSVKEENKREDLSA